SCCPGPVQNPQFWGPESPPPFCCPPSPQSFAMCHFFRSPSPNAGFHFVIGCWQITGIPLLLPGPLICHRAPYTASSHAAATGPDVCHGSPVRPPIAAVSYRHTLPCATFRSPHTLLVC
ncbi:unnamed protein product, partial [Staurois parvus]